DMPSSGWAPTSPTTPMTTVTSTQIAGMTANTRYFTLTSYILPTTKATALPAHTKDGPMPDNEDWIEESFYAYLPRDGVCLSHNGMLPLAAFPEGIPLLTEPKVFKTFAAIAKIRDADDEVVGFATELEEILPATDFTVGRLQTRTLWTLFLP